MEQFLFQNEPEANRAMHLDANSDGAEEREYPIILTQEELAAEKSKFTTLAIKKAKLDDQKKQIVSEINAELKPIIKEKQETLAVIKNGTRTEKGICYKIIERETRMVGYYNRQGRLVDQRPMTMEDNQLTIARAVNE